LKAYGGRSDRPSPDKAGLRCLISPRSGEALSRTRGRWPICAVERTVAAVGHGRARPGELLRSGPLDLEMVVDSRKAVRTARLPARDDDHVMIEVRCRFEV
jgi:hypothetical protein